MVPHVGGVLHLSLCSSPRVCVLSYVHWGQPVLDAERLYAWRTVLMGLRSELCELGSLCAAPSSSVCVRTVRMCDERL